MPRPNKRTRQPIGASRKHWKKAKLPAKPLTKQPEIESREDEPSPQMEGEVSDAEIELTLEEDNIDIGVNEDSGDNFVMGLQRMEPNVLETLTRMRSSQMHGE